MAVLCNAAQEAGGTSGCPGEQPRLLSTRVAERGEKRCTRDAHEQDPSRLVEWKKQESRLRWHASVGASKH